MKEQISISNTQQTRNSCAAAIIRATKSGIFEFVFEMLKVDPQFVWFGDASSANIFSVAVQYRRANVFSLIYGDNMIGSLARGVDRCYSNNLLHKAGMSAPSTSLNDIPGAALKMQRELQWFKVISLTFNFLVFNYWLYVQLNNY